jgi:hypothetical protein
MPLEAIQAYREIARALPVRAMWHAGEGRPVEAWHDLLALHRLAGLCTGDTMVEYLVGFAINNIACQSTYAFIGSTNLSAADARQILRDLSTLPSLPSMADCVDHGERIFSLGMISEAAVGGGGLAMLADSPMHPASNNLLNYVTVDWNIVFAEMNFWFDRLTAALQTPDPVARTAALNQVVADMQQAKSDAWTASKMMTSIFSRRQRSRLVATAVVDLLTPGIQSCATAENQADTMLDLARLAAALAVYHAEHAAYPEKLADLVPSILPKLPTDAYHGKPFLYRRTADGYLIYSSGENGDDDGGSNESTGLFEGRKIDDFQNAGPSKPSRIPTAADDIAIRLPQLPFSSFSAAKAATNP